jgi:rhamnose transport system ATP-binding protein
MADTQPILSVRGIGKTFGRAQVLHNIDLDLHRGEVHALVGENGAGKSTLTRIISGLYSPDEGAITLDGKVVVIPSPSVAQHMGIALIHQEPLSFPDLDVAENIFIGRQPRGAGGFIDWTTMYTEARQLLKQLGVSIDPRARVRGLSIADQQMVEMASALSQNARVLIMDEPTAALTPSEVGDLFTIVRQLRAQGTAILFISHRLEEVFDISDRISVLRDGELVGTTQCCDITRDEIIRMMVGRPLSALFEKDVVQQFGDARLVVRDLTTRNLFYNISFEVRAGEIVCLAGLVGARRTEVARAVFGIEPPDRGEVWLDGQRVDVSSPQVAVDLGMAYVPEDRQKHGLLLPMRVDQNMTLSILRVVSNWGWMKPRLEKDLAEEWRKRLDLRVRSVDQAAWELSGGNQQKVVLAKWLLTQPKVLILDEPTRGIDIGAKAEVHRLMNELAHQGIAILMISSELPEVLAMSDRIIVMREGHMMGEFTREQATPETVMAAAIGQVRSKTGVTA